MPNRRKRTTMVKPISLLEYRLAVKEYYRNEHGKMPDYIIPLVLTIVDKHFDSLGSSIGSLELGTRRGEMAGAEDATRA